MQILFDSRNPLFKEPFGCVAAGETLRLRLLTGSAAERACVLLECDGGETAEYEMEPEGEKGGWFHFVCSVPFRESGLYFYKFRLFSQAQELLIGKDAQNKPVPDGVAWQLLCYANTYKTPEAFQGKVMYQIFPDRFFQHGNSDCTGKLGPYWIHEDKADTPAYLPDETREVRNNDFYGGNINGILEKLAYLKELGVSLLYLNPVFMAYSNHRYDTADYLRIDPMLGTEADFAALTRAAHQNGMKIILDGVFSHTGDDSVYFDRKKRFGNGAYDNLESPYRSWYNFGRFPDEYDCWWGIKTLPCTNEMDESFLRFIVTGEDSVIRHWLRLGADGFRLDVADELPDGFLETLYETVKEENPEAVVIGEVWEDASNKISYGLRRKYLQGRQMDGVMNYVYKDAIIRFVTGLANGMEFSETVFTIAENYPPPALHCLMNSLSTHDTVRILNALSGVRAEEMSKEERAEYKLPEAECALAKSRLVPAAFLQFTLPGTACIYYGDEIGMQGFEDPFNRRFFTWEQQDGEIFQLVKELAAMKNEYECLQTGRIISGFCGERFVSYWRSAEDNAVFCAVNCGMTPITLPELKNAETIFRHHTEGIDGAVTILPNGCAAFLVK